jgi:hypothetical protein
MFAATELEARRNCEIRPKRSSGGKVLVSR